MCLPIPRGFEPWEAAGIPEVYATAYLNLRIVGELKKGETFFINGGEGGLGIACIQLAKRGRRGACNPRARRESRQGRVES